MFWSLPDVWYLIDYAWWESRRSGYLGKAQLDMDFAKKLEQVEIAMGWLEWEFAPSYMDVGNQWRGAELAEKAIIFWHAVKDSFPSARKIVLRGCRFRTGFPPPDGVFDPSWSPLSFVLEQAPRNLQIFISFHGPTNRILFRTQPTFREHKRLSVVSSSKEEPWSPTHVMPPSRQLPGGPLQDFEHMSKINTFIRVEHAGLQWLTRETHVRFPEEGGIRCPNQVCYMLFKDRLTWDDHCSHGWGFKCKRVSQEVHSANTPSDIVTALEGRYRRLSNLQEQLGEIWWKLRRAMGETGTEREEFVRILDTQVRKEWYTPSPQGIQHANALADEFVHTGFWSWFDRAEFYQCLVGEGYEDWGSPRTVGYDWEFDPDSDDGSDWGEPFVNLELQQRQRRQRDEFWEKAGFLPKERCIQPNLSFLVGT